jgi:protein-disulfide isomerase
MRGLIIATALGCAALIGIAIFFTVNSTGQGPRSVPISPRYEQRVSDGFWKRGASEPKVTVLEYLDFQCIPCQAVSGLVDEAFRQTQDIAQFQIRLYPVTDNNDKALLVARGAEAAGRQGKFWEMSNILFANQAEWIKTTPDAMKATLETYAQTLHLSADQFRSDMGDRALEEPIDRDRAAGNRLPIEGMPTFVINGEVVNNFPQTADALVALIKAAAR